MSTLIIQICSVTRTLLTGMSSLQGIRQLAHLHVGVGQVPPEAACLVAVVYPVANVRRIHHLRTGCSIYQHACTHSHVTILAMSCHAGHLCVRLVYLAYSLGTWCVSNNRMPSVPVALPLPICWNLLNCLKQ